MLFKTRGNGSPSGKPRIYFTCHPDDFELYFDKICKDIFKSHDCAVYYGDTNASIDISDLESINLFVVPVTFRPLTTPNRAMDEDIPFALSRHIPVLPLMMESGLDAIYSRPDRFGELQYLSSFSTDKTEVSFSEKLKKYLESVLISDEMAQRVRAAFDAYIFLSYRKKDRKYANQLMRIIHSKPECRGIAIWYDEFLTLGESFRENIDKTLSDSKLFTLLVTPNLLEEANFVMAQEYPAALKSGIEIIPAEMEETDKAILNEKYANLPEIANPYDDEAFRKRLADTLSRLAIKSNDTNTEHNFLIGLAYLDGIDVEVDRERALSLITSAAENELPEAMEKLYDMYCNGYGVKLDYHKATDYAKKLTEYYFEIDHPNAVRWLNTLGVCYQNIGDFHKSLEIFRMIHDSFLKNFGETNPLTVVLLSNLAQAYSKAGNPEKAVLYGEKSYSYMLKKYGTEHPASLAALSDLAAYHSGSGDYTSALEEGRQAFELYLKLYGSEHPDTLNAMNNLASYYSISGDHKKAIELCKEACDSFSEIYGEGHPDTITSQNSFARSYFELEEYASAAELFEKSYILSSELLGEEHKDTLMVLNMIALSYEKLSAYGKAADFYEKLYRANCRIYGENSAPAMNFLNSYASALARNNEHEKAAAMYAALYTACLKTLGKNHKSTKAVKAKLDEITK